MGHKGCFLFLFITLNTILLLLGLLMLGFGITYFVAPGRAMDALFDKERYCELSLPLSYQENADRLKWYGLFLLIVGAYVSLISAFGFSSGCKFKTSYNYPLHIYDALLTISILAEVALIIYMTIDGDRFDSLARQPNINTIGDLENLKDYGADASGFLVPPKDIKSKTIHDIQFMYKCCGNQNYTEYATLGNWMSFNCTQTCNPSYTVPISCCVTKTNNVRTLNGFVDYRSCLTVTSETQRDSFIYLDGCVERVNTRISASQQCQEIATRCSYVAIGLSAGAMLAAALVVSLIRCLPRSLSYYNV